MPNMPTMPTMPTMPNEIQRQPIRCSVCGTETRAKRLQCGHAFHTKCRQNSTGCPTCKGQLSCKTDCTRLADATKRITKATNGDYILTINQRDSAGYLTISRRIRASHVQQLRQVLAHRSALQQQRQLHHAQVQPTSLSRPVPVPATKPTTSLNVPHNVVSSPPQLSSLFMQLFKTA